jgi:hypothetical protein
MNPSKKRDPRRWAIWAANGAVQLSPDPEVARGLRRAAAADLRGDHVSAAQLRVMAPDIPLLDQFGDRLRREGRHVHYMSLGPYGVDNPQHCLTCGCTLSPEVCRECLNVT